MEKKSPLKYYLLGGIILVAVILIIVLSMGGAKTSGQKDQAMNGTGGTVNIPANPITGVSADSTTKAPVVTNAPITPAVTSTPKSASGLIGTWVSAVTGKGMQGTGKITLRGTVNQLSLTGDVNLVIKKVENNIGTGTITFDKVCITAVVSVPGKPDVTNPTQCLNAYSQPSTMQISGNKITYTGKSVLGANITLTGTYTSDTMSGTFTRTGSSGKINGTFSLARK